MTEATTTLTRAASLAVSLGPIDGRPRFVKRSVDDVEQVKIAAIDPDFQSRPQPLSLMECADRILNKTAHSKVAIYFHPLEKVKISKC